MTTAGSHHLSLDAEDVTGQTSRAIAQHRYGAPDALELTTIPTPSPSTDEVLVRVLAASINARDWHICVASPASPVSSTEAPSSCAVPDWQFAEPTLPGPSRLSAPTSRAGGSETTSSARESRRSRTTPSCPLTSWPPYLPVCVSTRPRPCPLPSTTSASPPLQGG